MAMFNRCAHHKKSGLARVVFGLLIIGLGAILLADNIGALSPEVKSIVLTWQMLIISIGIINLANREWFSALILIFIGAFFLIPEHTHFGFDFTRLFWPLLLIFFGVMILIKLGFRNPRKDNELYQSVSPADTIDDTAIFGGAKKIISSQNFCGGRLLAIFGGFEIDFTQARLAPGTQVIDLFCMFGGVTLIFPPDWEIRNQVTAVLGGVEDKRRLLVTDSNGNSNVIILKGLALLGGGEVKSYGRPTNG